VEGDTREMSEPVYCVYVDNELEETDLTKDEALDIEEEILDEDPFAMVRVEPMEDESEEEYEPEEDEEEDEYGFEV
jgi:hypothetical protein